MAECKHAITPLSFCSINTTLQGFQMRYITCTILLSKSEFSFALLLVTFEPLDIQQSYIPRLKALKCGINAVVAQGRDCSSLLCHAHLKMGVLLHKQATVGFDLILAVCKSCIANVCS